MKATTISDTEHPLNSQILITELQSTINSIRNSSPGLGNISNIFIQQLPKAGPEYLLEYYNYSQMAFSPIDGMNLQLCPY